VKYLNVDGYSMGTVKTASAEAEVLVETQPGHTYVLRGRRGSDRYEFWFEDMGVNYNQDCLAPELYVKKYVRGEDVPGC